MSASEEYSGKHLAVQHKAIAIVDAPSQRTGAGSQRHSVAETIARKYLNTGGAGAALPLDVLSFLEQAAVQGHVRKNTHDRTSVWVIADSSQ